MVTTRSGGTRYTNTTIRSNRGGAGGNRYAITQRPLEHGLGTLATLPREIRNIIYQHLKPTRPHIWTFDEYMALRTIQGYQKLKWPRRHQPPLTDPGVERYGTNSTRWWRSPWRVVFTKAPPCISINTMWSLHDLCLYIQQQYPFANAAPAAVSSRLSDELNYEVKNAVLDDGVVLLPVDLVNFHLPFFGYMNPAARDKIGRLFIYIDLVEIELGQNNNYPTYADKLRRVGEGISEIITPNTGLQALIIHLALGGLPVGPNDTGIFATAKTVLDEIASNVPIPPVARLTARIEFPVQVVAGGVHLLDTHMCEVGYTFNPNHNPPEWQRRRIHRQRDYDPMSMHPVVAYSKDVWRL